MCGKRAKGLACMANLPSTSLVSNFNGAPCIRGKCTCVTMAAARKCPSVCGVSPINTMTAGNISVRTARVDNINGLRPRG